MLSITEGGRLPLEEIEAFVAVAQAGSYTAAAEKLAISHSSLSRKVQHLEQLLGVRLFERRSHGVELTIAGTGHFLKFRDALGMLGSALREQSRNGRELVRVSLLQSFATTFLFPALPQMKDKISHIDVRYDFDRAPTDFRDGTDLAVRFGAGDWGGLRAIALWESTLRPIAGEAIAKRLGPNASPQEILAFPLIHMGSPTSWKHWFEAHGVDYEMRFEDHVFKEIATILSAIEHGLGIGLGRTETRRDIDDKRLFYVNPDTVPIERRYYLVRDGARLPRRATADFAKALLEAAGKPADEILAFLR